MFKKLYNIDNFLSKLIRKIRLNKKYNFKKKKI